MHNKQLLLAHRGYSFIAPENTKLAFDLAFEYCFDGIELDVHLTKDEQLVIIHDETTLRTALVNKEVEFESLVSLKRDDHSAFFHLKIQFQSILTLKEFLDLYLDKFKLINIEIKTDQKPYLGIEKKLVDLVKGYGKKAIDKILFSSFNFESLQKVYDLDNSYKKGFLFWTKKQFETISTARIQKICQFLHPWTKIYEKYPQMIKKLNLPLNLWTVNSQNKFQQFLADNHVYAQIANKKFEIKIN
ncbi:glycerophosphodiester phosphodiesterase [Mycoplasmoides genitalium]|uniref:Uncharacterized protein MG293 n=2 Tax=Mycoplasmoides genitalium TaxID=2097 RepID=Y293_MYCGE|nr:glycerophosphodiester phosphodiesterase [Mycoplasmoides genitalium]P47535.1 RecName: Full=Uncharacterized protein MG293 [Mycoplasmoides genitalium G37]ABY79432.1 glycerophosphoryl diester phosphodiesterase family protein [synthetic Mycoplasma genitalium JCVI-1.0]AAC71514.1 glycerophosphoryl diester phosphodiesterase family protein [Mycoplasmoides genitalium G37]AFQ03129.1 glycerophosphoryl diester phosphodiesterase [Mycoplasmoides genitalium M2321]AFQ03618.1 glycerophosphoryl diester phosph